MKKELRCNGTVIKNGVQKKCNKLLAKSNKSGILAAEIMCPRCGTLNNE